MNAHLKTLIYVEVLSTNWFKRLLLKINGEWKNSKKTRTSYFCVTQKSGALRACIIFSHITQKILTKYMFYGLELVNEILSFLQIFGVRKATSQFFKYFRKSARKWTKHDVFWHFSVFKSKLQIIHGATYMALFLPDSNNCFWTRLVL